MTISGAAKIKRPATAKQDEPSQLAPLADLPPRYTPQALPPHKPWTHHPPKHLAQLTPTDRHQSLPLALLKTWTPHRPRSQHHQQVLTQTKPWKWHRHKYLRQRLPPIRRQRQAPTHRWTWTSHRTRSQRDSHSEIQKLHCENLLDILPCHARFTVTQPVYNYDLLSVCVRAPPTRPPGPVFQSGCSSRTIDGCFPKWLPPTATSLV